MELFAKLFSGWNLLIISVKSSILDIWLSFVYASEVNYWYNEKFHES